MKQMHFKRHRQDLIASIEQRVAVIVGRYETISGPYKGTYNQHKRITDEKTVDRLLEWKSRLLTNV